MTARLARTACPTQRSVLEASRCWISCTVATIDGSWGSLCQQTSILSGLLAKGVSPSDGDGRCERSPEQTRPLSGSNTVSKLFPSSLVWRGTQAGATQSWVDNEQRGFANGRVMLQNVADCEALSIAASMTRSNAACVLFDFRAAFPSLSREWLFAVLLAAKLPPPVIQLRRGRGGALRVPLRGRRAAGVAGERLVVCHCHHPMHRIIETR